MGGGRLMNAPRPTTWTRGCRSGLGSPSVVVSGCCMRVAAAFLAVRHAAWFPWFISTSASQPSFLLPFLRVPWAVLVFGVSCTRAFAYFRNIFNL